MLFFINIFFVIFFHILIRIFFNFNKINFKQIIFLFLLSYGGLILFLNLNFIKIQNSDLDTIYLIINFLIFLSYILTIGLKKINSPTFYILESLEKREYSTQAELVEDLKKEKIFEERLIELQKENMIVLNNNKIFLTKNGKTFALFMKFLSAFFKVEAKG